MKKKLIISFIVLCISVIAIFLLVQYLERQKTIQRYEFSMNSINGKVSLSDFRGKYSIIYFGYMYCPDICPTTLSLISQALNKLKKEDAKKFQLIFISLDPQRDKLKDLDKYSKYFYPSAIGITSDEKYLKEVTSNYGTYYTKEYQENSKINYSVAHTSFVYIVDKNGILVKKIRHLEEYKPIYNALIELLHN